MIILGYCTKCDNRGFIKTRGEFIPLSDLTETQRAERIINGGSFYKVVEKPCPDLLRGKHN